MSEALTTAPPVKKSELAIPLAVIGAAVVLVNYWWLRRQAETVAESMSVPYIMDETGRVKRVTSTPPAHWMSGG